MLDARASYLSRRRLCRDQGAGGGNYENQNDGGDQTICCDGSVRLMIQHAPASLVGAEVSNFARPYAVETQTDPRPASCLYFPRALRRPLRQAPRMR
jgi:hypothetical protein